MMAPFEQMIRDRAAELGYEAGPKELITNMDVLIVPVSKNGHTVHITVTGLEAISCPPDLAELLVNARVAAAIEMLEAAA